MYSIVMYLSTYGEFRYKGNVAQAFFRERWILKPPAVGLKRFKTTFWEPTRSIIYSITHSSLDHALDHAI